MKFWNISSKLKTRNTSNSSVYADTELVYGLLYTSLFHYTYKWRLTDSYHSVWQPTHFTLGPSKGLVVCSDAYELFQQVLCL
jgi:hypothetical protein